LLNSLLETHEERLIRNLLLRNIQTTDLSFSLIDQAPGSISKFLNFSIFLQKLETIPQSPDFEQYLHDAQLSVFSSFKKTAQWEYKIVPESSM